MNLKTFKKKMYILSIIMKELYYFLHIEEKINISRQIIQCKVNCIMLYYTMYHIIIS